jgi:deoxycytidine triphosphate deaminase
MNPVNKNWLTEQIRREFAYCEPLLFLDEYKIALHIFPTVLRMHDEIDLLAGIKLNDLEKVDLKAKPLQRNVTYLGFSIQRIRLPQHVIGLLHTRSTLSRLGLDFFGSSTYVSPGFGAETPTQIIFEITPKITINNLPIEDPVAGLVLYKIDGVHPVWGGRGKHAARFPFTDLLPRGPQ